MTFRLTMQAQDENKTALVLGNADETPEGRNVEHIVIEVFTVPEGGRLPFAAGGDSPAARGH